MYLILIKFIDNLISSTKTLSTSKLNPLHVFLLTLLKSSMFFLMMKALDVNNNLSMTLAVISASIGSTIPVYFAKRKEMNIVDNWRFNIIMKSPEDAILISDKLKLKGIRVYGSKNYTSSKGKIVVSAISTSIEDSKYIKKQISKFNCNGTIDDKIKTFENKLK